VLPGVVNGSARSVADLDQVAQWFDTVRTERLNVVDDFFRDRTGQSLSYDELGLASVAAVYLGTIPWRQRTRDEVEAELLSLPAHLRSMHRPTDDELVEPAFSMLFDLGIFWGEVLRSAIPGLAWSIERREDLVSTGQPVLFGPKSKSRFCPNQVLLTCAKQSIEGRLPPDGVLKYHHSWLKLL